MATRKAKSSLKSLDPQEDRRLVLAAHRLWTWVCSDPQRVLRYLFGSCAALLVLDLAFLIGLADKHAHFIWENWLGFYAVYGFVSCVLLVLFAKHVLRPTVKREEDYYD